MKTHRKEMVHFSIIIFSKIVISYILKTLIFDLIENKYIILQKSVVSTTKNKKLISLFSWNALN